MRTTHVCIILGETPHKDCLRRSSPDWVNQITKNRRVVIGHSHPEVFRRQTRDSYFLFFPPTTKMLARLPATALKNAGVLRASVSTLKAGSRSTGVRRPTENSADHLILDTGPLRLLKCAFNFERF